MQNDDIEIGIPHRLAHLPLVVDVLRRTGLLNFLDGIHERVHGGAAVRRHGWAS